MEKSSLHDSGLAVFSQSTDAGGIMSKRKRSAPLPALQNAAIKKRTVIAQL
jgi:hypothetical protein